MKASEAKLQRVIEGTNQYVVPLFQRKIQLGQQRVEYALGRLIGIV